MRARIEPVAEETAGPVLKATYRMVKRTTAKVVGKPVQDVLTPLAVAAHRPWIMRAFGLMELALDRSRHMPFRLRELGRAKAGTIVGCPW